MKNAGYINIRVDKWMLIPAVWYINNVLDHIQHNIY